MATHDLPSEKDEKIRDYFRADPSRMTMVGAMKFGVPEEQVVRLLIGQWPIVELRAEAFKEIMEAIKEMGTMRVFVRGSAAVVEVIGKFREFSEEGGFFNVDGEGIDMHISPKKIASIFAVEKSSHDAKRTTYSFQFYDPDGNAGFKVFLWENFPDEPLEFIEKFRAATQKFRRVA